uniref:MYND-type domain-containing protein n=1 Tax=Schizophyllum commune (strain H4-8 / FGSC 9210) TaxID=578458 RepID=D8QKE2_SCHCM
MPGPQPPPTFGGDDKGPVMRDPSSTTALYDDLLADWSVHGMRQGTFPRFLQRPIPQEVFARLNPSRIPKHPLDKAKAVAIQDAVEALSAYIWYFRATEAHSGAGVSILLDHLPDVWKWVKFLLRTSGNLHHTRDERRDVRYENKVYLDSDGNVHMGMATCNTLLGEIFVHILQTDAGPAACFARADFIDIVCTILTTPFRTYAPGNWPNFPDDLAKSLLSLLQSAKYGSRVLAKVMSFDEQNDCCLARSLVDRLAWFFEDRLSESERHIRTYISLAAMLLQASPECMSNFRRRGGIALIVYFLVQVRPAPKLMQPAANLHGAPKFGMSVLLDLAASMDTVSPIVEAFDAGVLRILVQLCLFEDDTTELEFRQLSTRYIQTALGPALLWPDVLRACRKAIKVGHFIVDIDDRRMVDRVPELRAFFERYRVCLKALTDLRAETKALQHCHRAECPGSTEPIRHICACGAVYYCSRICQKADWRARHRITCTRGIEASAPPSGPWRSLLHGGPAEPPEMDPAPISMSYLERMFIKRCVMHPNNLPALPQLDGGMGGERLYIVDWTGREMMPSVIDVLESESSTEGVRTTARVYARIRKGSAVGTIHVGTLDDRSSLDARLGDITL